MTIIFDMGGVLVHMDWDKVCGPLAERSSRKADYVRRQVVNGPIVQSSMKGLIGPRQFYEALCGDLGIDISYADFIYIWTRLTSANEGIVPLVERLKEEHQLILASNTDEIHFAYAVKHFPVLGNFGVHFLSYEMGLVKPDPAFFHQMLEKLDTTPYECVFIDDLPENVESARSIGITALRFENNENLQSHLSAVL